MAIQENIEFGFIYSPDLLENPVVRRIELNSPSIVKGRAIAPGARVRELEVDIKAEPFFQPSWARVEDEQGNVMNIFRMTLVGLN